MQHPRKTPKLLYARDDGNFFDHPHLETMGRSGNDIVRLQPSDFILLPDGSDIYLLKGHSPIGFNKRTGRPEVLRNHTAISAFIAPAHTQTYLAASQQKKDAGILPLYAYSAVGFLDGKMWATALRIDPDIRQDCDQFDQRIVEKNVAALRKKFPANRLIEHVAHCATAYYCPAARNFYQFRWEAPLPSSPACNSRCIGCISWQPPTSGMISPQNRINFVPTPDEIAELALFHIAHAPNPVVSFGQGCEGEPLHVWETLLESIKLIRAKTSNGIINLNTNGSKSDAIEKLIAVGLDSIRISMNSAQEALYNIYYRPTNYSFADLAESCRITRKAGKWVSLNYFVFPGVTDTIAEAEALCSFIDTNRPNMIQWRNFNIDPDLYGRLAKDFSKTTTGIVNMINMLKQRYPNMYHGYFNPGKEIQERLMGK
ncbi:MAG: radical SAM protein [Bacteroidetes bacterium HGW-Bacteroidetes-6]|jgi:pyruvate-formate lyase-activating enzyme|nr:MAG: radical SAM protein [Bacteroidetes bacterium HGW-Bacteroidetes-6]